VTFQIGLFCPSGMALAGDTKAVEVGVQTHTLDHAPISWNSTAPKFLYDEPMNTVVAVSGDATVAAIADLRRVTCHVCPRSVFVQPELSAHQFFLPRRLDLFDLLGIRIYDFQNRRLEVLEAEPL
jgi:hypothetical protein